MPELEVPLAKKRKQRKRKPKPGEPITMPAWLFITLSLTTMTAGFVFFRSGDYVGVASVVLIAFAGISGFKMGLGTMSITLAAGLAAIWFAPAVGMRYESQLAGQLETTGLMSRVIAIAVAAVLISLVVTTGFSIIKNLYIKKRYKLRLVDHYSGLVVGIAEGALLVWLVLGGLLSLQLWQRHQGGDQNRIARHVDQIASAARQSRLGPYLVKYNPFERIDELKKVREFHETACRLRDPENIDRLINDRAIIELKSEPTVARAIDEIQNDPSLRAFIDEGRPPGRDLLIRLINSPSVKEMVDHPDFLPRIREALGRLDR